MPIRVLVVDDEPGIRELLTEYLGGRGMDVVAVGDGETALGVLQRDPPDLVLVDIKLPGIDGIDVVNMATACVPPVPAVMMSGFSSADAAVAAFNAGARDCLAKPFRLRDLYACVERVLATAARDRRAAWADAAMALLLRSEIAETPEDAEALVPALLELLEAAPDGARAILRDTPGPSSLPLGAGRWIDPPIPAGRPCIRAVHEALGRVGR
ncbi:MAG: response regulator [Pseudomonadota bacterium]|nr:response regulator [Pseudomonadota bacterium]